MASAGTCTVAPVTACKTQGINGPYPEAAGSDVESTTAAADTEETTTEAAE